MRSVERERDRTSGWHRVAHDAIVVEWRILEVASSRMTSSPTTTGRRWRGRPRRSIPSQLRPSFASVVALTRTSPAAELAAIRQDWDTGGRPPPKSHVHRTPVRFADGTTVMGVRFLGDDPYVRDDAPGFGLYLDERWAPPWPHEHVDWPDFGVPDDLDGLRRVLTDLLDRARKGQRVEVGCLGGHGRTGTALACLAVLTGTPASDAVAWVRANYCYKAVETDVQEQLVATFSM
jgi:hypothetical protein